MNSTLIMINNPIYFIKLLISEIRFIIFNIHFQSTILLVQIQIILHFVFLHYITLILTIIKLRILYLVFIN